MQLRELLFHARHYTSVLHAIFHTAINADSPISERIAAWSGQLPSASAKEFQIIDIAAADAGKRLAVTGHLHEEHEAEGRTLMTNQYGTPHWPGNNPSPIPWSGEGQGTSAGLFSCRTALVGFCLSLRAG